MSDSGGGVFIDVHGFRVVREASGREYIVFIIKIRLGAFAWTVYRRFTQFRALGEAFRRTIPDAPPCPPKRLLGAHTPEFVEQRRVELLEWVRSLARDEHVCRSPEFHEFLRAQANTPPVGMIDVVSPPLITSSMLSAEAAPPMQQQQPQSGAGYYPGGAAVDRRVVDDGIMEDGGIALPIGDGSGGGGGAYRPGRASDDSDGVVSMAPSSAAPAADVGGASTPKIGLREFSLLKVVGKGSFGKVMQVRKRDTGRIYAMKVLHKSNVIKRNQVEHTRTERSVLGRIVHPFIVGLNYAFQTADKLFFVLDYW
jgi:serum/glucocorticoid-regulated kinase 2